MLCGTDKQAPPPPLWLADNATPGTRPLFEIASAAMFCPLGSSPEEVYPLLLLQTEPSEPAGDGVGDMALPVVPLEGEQC